MKQIGNELTTRNDEHTSNLTRLQSLKIKLLSMYSANHHIHELSLMPVQALNKILSQNEYYRMILEIPGEICEFGVHFGSSFSTWINLRNIYEPFNASRIVHGFDTFSGFPKVSDADGKEVSVGDYASFAEFKDILGEIAHLHESFSPQSHLKKYHIHVGDVSETFAKLLQDRPHTSVALAYFDLDLYEPTRDVLNMLLPKLTKGSVLVFDEFNCEAFSGETKAVQEVLNTKNIRLKRLPFTQFGAYMVWGD